MANPLDIGLLDSLSVIFSIILVFAIMYGILAKTKFFGDNHGIHAIIAFAAAIFLSFAPGVNKVIVTMVPWFIVMIIFLFLLLQFYSFMGMKESDLLSAYKNDRSISTWILIVGFLILIASLSSVYFTSDSGQGVGDASTDGAVVEGNVGDTGTGAFFATIFHPKVLGMIIIMLIGTFTITLLTSGGSTK